MQDLFASVPIDLRSRKQQKVSCSEFDIYEPSKATVPYPTVHAPVLVVQRMTGPSVLPDTDL